MDADQGNFLQLQQGKPSITPIHNRYLAGQVRKIKPISIKGKQAYIVAKNNGAWQILQ
jgi:hypothetical protein